jgi:hypothetical protein
MRNNQTFLLVAVAVLASISFGDIALAQQNKALSDFYGVYVGRATATGADEIRDLDVIIEPNKRGFSIDWSAVIRNGEKRAVRGVKRRSTQQAFQKSQKGKYFEPIAAGSVFSVRKKRDIVGGDPVIWAHIHGETLSVHSLVILEDGTYELQIYDRVLTPLGMDVNFRRYDDGILTRVISGNLARTED